MRPSRAARLSSFSRLTTPPDLSSLTTLMGRRTSLSSAEIWLYSLSCSITTTTSALSAWMAAICSSYPSPSTQPSVLTTRPDAAASGDAAARLSRIAASRSIRNLYSSGLSDADVCAYQYTRGMSRAPAPCSMSSCVSMGTAAMQPGAVMEPCPTSRSTNVGCHDCTCSFRLSSAPPGHGLRTAQLSSILVSVDLPESVGPTMMTRGPCASAGRGACSPPAAACPCAPCLALAPSANAFSRMPLSE
mmetsp:Transcript_22927/g.58532  ORF Transcript_22927/g.58532 Transcript_22927/m.58532 type:complete len:246 (-) Transcript_22927:335-1072(-)